MMQTMSGLRDLGLALYKLEVQAYYRLLVNYCVSTILFLPATLQAFDQYYCQ